MRRALIATVSAAAALAAGVAGTALALPGTTYDALLAPSPGSTATGAAVLVDGDGGDTLTVRLQGLAPGAAYDFHVHETEAPGDPCVTRPPDAHPHEGWLNTALVADPAGVGVGVATAPAFTLHAHETYWVDVESADGAVVACGVLAPRPA